MASHSQNLGESQLLSREDRRPSTRGPVSGNNQNSGANASNGSSPSPALGASRSGSEITLGAAAGAAAPAIPDDESDQHYLADVPLTMAASVMIAALPHDAHAALENAGSLPQEKVTVRFQAVGSAPILRKKVYTIKAKSPFAAVVNFLRKRPEIKGNDSVFLYVNSVFAPSLDEEVGNLYRCFKRDDQLIIAYSTTPAFG
ncbi:APG12-domain-containing protein [Xylona heveae TC161]|uniref:Ubiquitin-like protein ATG12 n=1 Tax=Xylona heveae (strain CBS 132557 / TC161) TaxID=1328760 RepID=A0A165FL60_XYLHT|nr:APG12-domain-containing protein [Xylona heveae TC161]KZF21105.1 APG12-domain-containing protein [Xylona heveae TC161]